MLTMYIVTREWLTTTRKNRFTKTQLRSSTWQFSHGLCSTTQQQQQQQQTAIMAPPTTEMRVPAHLWAPSSFAAASSPSSDWTTVFVPFSRFGGHHPFHLHRCRRRRLGAIILILPPSPSPIPTHQLAIMSAGGCCLIISSEINPHRVS